MQRLNVDAAGLEAALRRETKGEVRFDDGSRALYSTDASNYRQVPIGVVLPRDVDDVIATVALARKFGAPILARGAGTSLAGQCCNVAVVMDMSKYMNGIVEMNPREKFARVQPGIVLDDLRAAAEKHTLTFGPDPATHAQCTLGGMIGNNSCGVHGLMAGKTVDNIEELEILTYDGHRMRVGRTSEEELERIIAEGGRRGGIYAGLKRIRDQYAGLVRVRFPNIPRRVSGYNLDELLPENGFNVARALVGSECTCVVVLEAKCRLVYSPPARALVVAGYENVYVAADAVPSILEFKPIGLEGFDDLLVSDMRAQRLHPEGVALLPPGSGWLLIEFGGETQQQADDEARRLMDALSRLPNAPSLKLMETRKQERMVWAVRESGLGATAHVPGRPPMWEGWEDAAVAPEKLGGYLRDLRKLLERHEFGGDLYGHFGEGCVHTRTNFDLQSKPGIAKFRAFLDDAADLVASYGGSFSGEHGDGQARGALLGKMFGPELMEAFREFKSLWDPEWKMNPGKLITPYEPDENLRLGASYAPWEPKTHFHYEDDKGLMSRAVMRCVGVGRCRRLDGGTMCPSYQVTREEEHSTRGRAHLLFEMFQGERVAATWRNETVKEALDLCLACKGCKGDCPTGVDVATYKAEFLSHYYAGRLRPLPAYTMGWIYWWAGLASHAPRLANAFMRMPGLKQIGGIASQRRLPVFARKTFRQQFKPLERPGAKRVMLWPDTFNNHFFPQTALAAAEVLETAGYQVVIPEKRLCCGRPLYDWGFLGMAKRLLRETLTALRPELDRGTLVAGLEPSCVSVFRDELLNLFPRDDYAKRLAESSLTLTQFIQREGDAFPIPQLRRKAMVQAHCHHKAVMLFDAEDEVMRKMGLEVEHPDSGCCGMAGAFGFQRDHYEISMKVGERVILPAVREADADALIIADGFSCREQIAQATGRHPLHIAEVLRMAQKSSRA
ncbi:MAG TPA: FAD-binding and (Fe-S)-binding domain-containing protein [Thermoanaerobaculia bacterium]|nr:FAD-binding and (Fe-S)-binding domain-containing protein [Thermoanaerobaculia bacterium]